ncbi:type IV pilus secretin PilQ [Thiohalocapsa marina]|uniref:Type IV pilus secretin PilQ n=1 Tax=Thiohalocapsa marina TaxID=424902 RepID=A0A5M8FKX2_9GAMM|nr:type IV pilus secretin PilQ [Thiohalocapsa marina]
MGPAPDLNPSPNWPTGRSPAGSRTATGASLLWLLYLLCALPSSAAAVVLKAVEFASSPGNQVEIDLLFSGPPPAPSDFSTNKPARIAIDFAGAGSGIDTRPVPIGLGAAHSLVAIEAGGRTRVVINLDDAVPYSISTRDDRATVVLNPDLRRPDPAAASAAATDAAAGPAQTPSAAPLPATAAAGQATRAVRDIDFRRGAGGEGRVLITLPSPETPVDVREEGHSVVLEIADTRLPRRLYRRLDVTDFATPVTAVEARGIDGNVRIDIKTDADYDYLAYQTDNLFTVELRGLTPAEKEQRQREQIVFSGDRLSLNFQDIEVRAVLQLLADFTGLNLVASDTVGGSITLRLKNVPWDQALDIILKTKGLSMRQSGNVIMVAPTQEIAAQEKLELESQMQIEELAPLRSEFIQVNYAKAAELARLLKSAENNLLTPERGSITVDDRTNTLLVQDTAARLEDIRGLVTRLDVPVRQVMIESRVVIANNDFARDLGVRFGVSGSMGRLGSNELNVAGGLPGNTGVYDFDKGPFGAAFGASEGGTVVPFNSGLENPAGSGNEALMVSLPADTLFAPSGAINLLLGKVGSHLIQLELSAMQREGRGEVISSPRVITSDQSSALIKVGAEIPYQEQTGEGNTSVAFKEAVLKLEVTPHITPDDRIIMDLQVSKDNPDWTRSVEGVPPIDTRSVETSVLVEDGETVVLGGVYEREKSFNREQVPWLGDLPVVGNLFRQTARVDYNEELLIFVTPKILRGELTGR